MEQVAGVELGENQEIIGAENAHPTYKIVPAPPRGLSYARGIAIRYGISFEQLTEHWKEQQGEGKDRPQGG